MSQSNRTTNQDNMKSQRAIVLTIMDSFEMAKADEAELAC